MSKPQLTHGSLFAGIGGFDLGFERAGFKTVWQVEIDEYCRRVLQKNFPQAYQCSDINGLQARTLQGVSVISGGFPCQPVSQTGRRLGEKDDRFLWPQMLGVVRYLRPAFVVVENVANLAHEFDWLLEKVCDKLEAEGYEVLPPLMVPACAFGAWHQRDRIWIIAHLASERCEGERIPIRERGSRQAIPHPDGSDSITTDSRGFGLEGSVLAGNGRSAGEGIESRSEIARTVSQVGDWWAIEPEMVRVVHGIPARVVRPEIEALGNAVVPQIAQWIAERIKARIESENHEHGLKQLS